jgi:hypothetical protein
MPVSPGGSGDRLAKVGAFGAQGQERRRPPHVKEK